MRDKNNALQSTNSVLQLKDVVFAYPSSGHTPALPILDIPQLRISKGQHCFLYGPSGTGKSTLLNMLGGLLKPHKGHVKVLDTDLYNLSSSRRDTFRARHTGIVFQQFNLLPYLSVLDNLHLAAQFSGQADSKTKVTSRAAALFDGLNLAPKLFNRRADRLSVGQQQRVAIARALINQPQLLLADEPTSSLDQNNRDSFIELLGPLLDEWNCTLLLVSHDPGLGEHFQHHLNLATLNRACSNNVSGADYVS